MTALLIILVGVVIAAQWVHLWLRQRGNPRLGSSASGGAEPQVVGLAAGFISMSLLWVLGLRSAFLDDATAPNVLILIAALIHAVMGAGLRVAAIERIGRGFSWGTVAPDALITDGVYRHVKHPLIIGYVLEAAGLGLCMPVTSATFLFFLLITFSVSVCAAVQIRKEERVLAARFPQEWPEYAKDKPI